MQCTESEKYTVENSLKDTSSSECLKDTSVKDTSVKDTSSEAIPSRRNTIYIDDYYMDKSILIDDYKSLKVYFHPPKFPLSDTVFVRVISNSVDKEDVCLLLGKEALDRYVYEIINMKCNYDDNDIDDEDVSTNEDEFDMYLLVRDESMLIHVQDVRADLTKREKQKFVKQFNRYYNLMTSMEVVL